MCLYTEIIKNQHKEIMDFDFSLDCLKPDVIIESMKEEKDSSALKVGKKKLFDIKELYCTDTSTFIMTIILLYRIINNKVQGEYSYE